MVDLDLIYELEGREYMVDRHLVIDKGLTQDEVDKIKELHIELLMTEGQLNTLFNKDDIKAWYSVWEQIQLELQEAWGLEPSINNIPAHHLSLCSCPKAENDNKLGTPFRIIDSNCRLHSALRGEK